MLSLRRAIHYYLKVSVSDLKDEDFAQAAEEYKQKQAAKSTPCATTLTPDSQEERENIWKQPTLYLAFVSGVGVSLLGLGVYWLIKRKAKNLV